MLSLPIALMERGYLPDWLVRYGVRRLCNQRLREMRNTFGNSANALRHHVDEISRAAVAFATEKANEQHYELPAEFFQLVLGPRKKYSCCHWDGAPRSQAIGDAEDQALLLTMDRAELEDGMKILELGCGWGSLTLTMAASFPRAQITAVSNSRSQREYIEAEARRAGLKNIEVITADLATTTDLGPGRNEYDRIVSVEMMEHLRNYQEFFRRAQCWLKPGGKLFTHIFTHRDFPYFFETRGSDNWMGRYFFTGGQMPSRNLLPQFQEVLTLEQQWEWSGTHYQKTSEAWLQNMDLRRIEVQAVLERVYGPATAKLWFHRWRVFFISCAELFGYDEGTEWGVSHYLFHRKDNL